MTKIVKKDETPVKAAEAVKAPVAVEETKAVKEEVKAVKKEETKAAPKAPKAVKEKKAPKAAAKTAKASSKAAKATKEKKAAKPKAAKAPKAEKATASAVKVFVEYQGRQMDMDAILEAVKAAAGVKRAKSLEVYVKPEDGAAYYVVNGKDSGKAAL